VTSPTAAVAFVGLGNMGIPLSRRLVEAGHAVAGYDVSGDARRRASEHGVREAASLGEVVTGAGLLILMLPGSDAVAAVLSDTTLLERIEPDALVIDMSSSEPLRTRDMAASLRAHGIKMIDAPVSGGVAGAEKGTLTVMVGGEKTDLARASTYLERMGRVVHAGPIGSGHAVKALNNLLSATHLWITSEAMIAGERFGIDPQVLLSIFNSSSGRSGSTENKWPNFILPGTFNSGFGIRLMVKDMNIAVELTEQVGVPSGLGSEALALWSRAAEGLPPTADHTEIARFIGAGAGPGG